MKLLDLLRAHWNILGLDAPKFAWIAAVGLLVTPCTRAEVEAMENRRLASMKDVQAGLTQAFSQYQNLV